MKKILIVVLCLVCFIFASCQNGQTGSGASDDSIPSEKTDSPNDEMGNSSCDTGWIYYLNGDDNYSLYKIRNDGTQRTKIIEDSLYYYQIVDDWIYYSPDEGEGIYKIHTDGMAKTKLTEEDVEYLFVADGWIYYTNVSFTDTGLYKIKSDGTGRTKLNENEMVWGYRQGDWLYYSNLYDTFSLHRIHLDGTEEIQLTGEKSYVISIDDEWIYYYMLSGSLEYIYKICIDGTGNTQLTYSWSDDGEKVDDWIYYINKDDGSSLYKIRTDGTDNTKLFDNDKVSSIKQIVDGWIYYENLSDGAIYRIQTNGEGRTQVLVDPTDQVSIEGNWLYYINPADNYSLNKIRIDGTEKTKITHDYNKKFYVVVD